LKQAGIEEHWDSGLNMFAQFDSATARRQRWMRWGSVALHAGVLGWLLHPPAPQLINPSSITFGQRGTSVTRLYWASKNPDESTASSPDQATERYRHQRLSHDKLQWKAPAVLAKLAAQPALTHSDVEDQAKTQTLSALGHGAQAGLPYGTLNRGPAYGEEVRPALPIATSDPVVWPWQLPDSAGNEVIEITIDERGEIVHKAVLQSLGPDIDTKCLAALENWHFHPATRNGAPIASKQDAIFPFRARG
jgi:hypothetical protein